MFREQLKKFLHEASLTPQRIKGIEHQIAMTAAAVNQAVAILKAPPPTQYEVLLLWLDNEGWPRMQSFTGDKRLPGVEHSRDIRLDWTVPKGGWLVARNCEFRLVRLGNYQVNDGNGSTLAILPEWKLGNQLEILFK